MRISRISAILAGCALASFLPAQSLPPGTGTTTTMGTAAGTTGPSTTGITGLSTPAPIGPPGGISPDPTKRGGFFFGKVALSDGTPPPSSVIIERFCGGAIHPQAYTDPQGGFSFQTGEAQDVLPDPTDGPPSNDISGSPYNQEAMQATLASGNCELRASLAGYRSDAVSLTGRRGLGDSNLGTIFLHSAKTTGLTVSATSALAPKEARKAYEKGLEAAKKSKLDQARGDFLKATGLDARYAAAWLELGCVYEQQGKIPEAREAYNKSIAADSRFVAPYERLYMLAFAEKKWPEVAAVTERVASLDPYDYPGALYFNAVANSELGKLDVAEQSARRALAMSAAQNPKVNYVLAVILVKKQDFKGAAECLRAYLKSGAVTDRASVMQMLANVEKQLQTKAELRPVK